MKGTITLIVLGTIGLAQYVYFQFTPLAYKFVGVVVIGQAPDGSDIIGEIIWERDWIVGLGGAIIGAILLGIGIYRLKHRKARVVDS